MFEEIHARDRLVYVPCFLDLYHIWLLIFLLMSYNYSWWRQLTLFKRSIYGIFTIRRFSCTYIRFRTPIWKVFLNVLQYLKIHLGDSSNELYVNITYSFDLHSIIISYNKIVWHLWYIGANRKTRDNLWQKRNNIS